MHGEFRAVLCEICCKKFAKTDIWTKVFPASADIKSNPLFNEKHGRR